MIITFRHLANSFENLTSRLPCLAATPELLHQPSVGPSFHEFSRWNDSEVGENEAQQSININHTYSTVWGSFKNYLILHWLFLMIKFGDQSIKQDIMLPSDWMDLWPHSPRPRPQHIRLAAVLLSSVSRDGHVWKVRRDRGELWMEHVTGCSRYVICICLFYFSIFVHVPWRIGSKTIYSLLR